MRGYKNRVRSESSIDLKSSREGGSYDGCSQTVEFHSLPKHDENFNETTKTIEESWASVVILKNPEYFGNGVYELSLNLAEIIRANLDNSFFIKVMSDDVSRDGQFARINKSVDEMLGVLESDSFDPALFAKKILMLKAFGAYVIDHAQHNKESNGFITKHEAVDYGRIISQYRPDSLFDARGRTGIKGKTERGDIGIMSANTKSKIKNQGYFTIPGLSKERPLFRTFINDKASGKVSTFIERTFDKDEPLIGAISGSTSCIMVAAKILKKTGVDNTKLALSAAAFLVGGGYHSQAEVMAIALPGMTMHDGIRDVLPKSIYQKNLLVLNEEIGNARRNRQNYRHPSPLSW